MGTWGVGPFDNDDASDMIAKLMKPIEIVETRRSNRSAQYHYNEARAAVQILLLSHATDILGGPELLPAVRVLARIRSDTEWIAEFESSADLIDRLNQELDVVLHRMQECKGCKKSHKEACKIADEARNVTVTKQPRMVRKKGRNRGRRVAV